VLGKSPRLGRSCAAPFGSNAPWRRTRYRLGPQHRRRTPLRRRLREQVRRPRPSSEAMSICGKVPARPIPLSRCFPRAHQSMSVGAKAAGARLAIKARMAISLRLHSRLPADRAGRLLAPLLAVLRPATSRHRRPTITATTVRITDLITAAPMGGAAIITGTGEDANCSAQDCCSDFLTTEMNRRA